MRVEDLRSLSQIGQALWGDPELSHRRTAETLQAVGFLPLADEKILERASTALLARATSERGGVLSAALANPFFRLLPEERFLLAALHAERWSYRRLARVLESGEEEVACRAWKLRVHLASQYRGTERPLASLGAAGAVPTRPSCPEFDPTNPWTQRFLDEEIPSRERLFLQNHLMACGECRGALARCRDLYYSVEGMIPKALAGEGDSARIQALQEAFFQVRRRVSPSEVTWRGAIRSYLGRTEAQLLLAGLLTWLAIRIFT